ncbi:hypothetical protein K1T71_014247 [Dendrolimus kikuchii]|uniref:Uncharacterized protein n=1 Tax=Dendrolimus kikuchii TaxID=765133 RepID=A0ACC1CFR9_9NEOP|nr:hypothetical protein K1T71_014247 [Dendrolimus kikuchii]
MNTLTILLISILLLTKINPIQCQNQVIPRNIMASVLQDVLSPANTENAIQMIKMAAASTNRRLTSPELSIPVQTYVQRGRDIPPRLVTNEMQVPVRIANEMQVPVRMANEIQMPVRMANEIQVPIRVPNEITPNIILQQSPVRTVMPNELILQDRSNDMQRIVVNEIGMPVQKMYMPEKQMSSVIDTCMKRMPQMPMMNYLPEDVLPRMPVGMANPFMPAASPISAFLPSTLGSLPLPTQARGQFLRKIPIPPPTL